MRVITHIRGAVGSNWLLLLLFVASPFAPLAANSQAALINCLLITVYVVLANSMSLLFRSARILPVAHAAFMGIGAYAAAIGFDRWGLGFWAALPAAIILPAFTAGIVGFISFRAKGFYLFMITFAFAQFFVLAAQNMEWLTNGESGILVINNIHILGFSLDSRKKVYYLFMSIAFLSFALIWAIERTPFGRRLVAIRDDEALAESLGINTKLYKIMLFMMSASVAGIAGVMWLYTLRAINPTQFGGFAFLLPIEMVIIGGVSVLGGTIVGAILLVLVPGWLGLQPNQRDIVFGILLILIMVGMPRGLGPAIEELPAQLWALRNRLPWRRISPRGGPDPADE